MSIERGDFDAIDETDLQELVDGQVAESDRIEYKSAAYGNSDKDKHELLKDFSAFANTHGGHILLGVEEVEGVATNLPGLHDCDVDQEMLRMESIIQSGLEPRVSEVRMKAVALANGLFAILVRVPHSWNPPHRVIAKGHNRFYMRHSSGVYQPSIEELRVLFAQTTTAIERAQQFRDERIQAVCSDSDYLKLQGPGHVFLHIVPIAAFSGMISLDVNDINREYESFRILSDPPGITPVYNYHGFAVTHGGYPEISYGYTQIFRNGCVESTYDRLTDVRGNDSDQSTIVYGSFEKHILTQCPKYMTGLKRLGVPPPFIIMITLVGVQDARLLLPHAHYVSKKFLLNDLRLPACFLESYGDEADYHSALRPAFDALWNTIGHSGDPNFDETGRWLGPGGYE